MIVPLEQITPHVVVDTLTQGSTRSCVLGGVSLGNYVVAIESGDSLDVGTILRKSLKSHFNLPVHYFFLTHTHTDHRKGMDAFKDVTLLASSKCIDNMPKSVRFGKWTVETFENTMTFNDEIRL